MISKEILDKYKISEFELNSIISKMKSIIFDTYEKSEGIPVAIFTGGQPGAGKSAIVSKSKIDLVNNLTFFHTNSLTGKYISKLFSK